MTPSSDSTTPPPFICSPNSPYAAAPIDADPELVEGVYHKFGLILFKSLALCTTIYGVIPLFFIILDAIDVVDILSRFLPDSPKVYFPGVLMGGIRHLTNGVVALFLTVLIARWIVRAVAKLDRWFCKK